MLGRSKEDMSQSFFLRDKIKVFRLRVPVDFMQSFPNPTHLCGFCRLADKVFSALLLILHNVCFIVNASLLLSVTIVSSLCKAKLFPLSM